MTDITKCLSVSKPFNKAKGVYLTHEGAEYIKTVIVNQQQYIEALEIQIEKLMKENQEPITGIGQC